MATPLEELVERFQTQEDENALLRENLDRLEGIIDRGWRPLIASYDEQEGPTLEQIQETAVRNRELMALNPHVGNGLELINSYVWADGVHYEGVTGKKQGPGTNVQERIEKNQESFFSPLARKQRQTAFYCDGIALYYGNDDDQTLTPVSITYITNDLRDPENPAVIWAYRYTYTRRSTVVRPVTINEWIFTHKHHDKIDGRTTINYGGVNEPIAVNKRMFVKKSNPVVGWAYGLSDVQRGISHAENYRRAMANGEDMNASMASVWATAKNNTAAGAAGQAAQVGSMTGSGALASVGQNNALNVLTTAGQAYDFARLLPILANFAAGIGVSVIALSMNSGNAGGSYGAARSLDRPEQLSTKTRRAYNAELDREVLVWLGVPETKIDVWFDPIIDLTEKYRGEQIAELRLGTGLHEGIAIKRMHAELDGKDPEKVTPVPEGWLIPNNEKSEMLRQIDPNINISGQVANGGGLTPTQGSGAKTVKTGSGDQKSDDIRTNREALLEMMQTEDMLEVMRELIHELAQARGRE